MHVSLKLYIHGQVFKSSLLYFMIVNLSYSCRNLCCFQKEKLKEIRTDFLALRF